MNWAWMGLYWVVAFVVPLRKLGKGAITRALRRATPAWLRVLWRPYWPVNLTRAAVAFAAASLASSGEGQLAIFWTVVIVFDLDDFYFGDDDRWRRLREGVRNRVRWLMELPAPPREREGTA